MSPLLRSELRLRLGPRQSEAALWRAGLNARAVGEASTPGCDDESLERLMDALQAEGHTLPARATACIADEYLYYAILPATGAWSAAQKQAQRYFREALGTEDLMVQTSLSPCGRHWIAVAVDSGRIDQVREALARRDIELCHVWPALLQDLAAQRTTLPADDALLVVMRVEGAVFVDLQAGSIDGIAWERIGPEDAALLAARVQGHLLRRSAAQRDPGPAPAPAVLIAPADAAQREQLQSLAQTHGWHLTVPMPLQRA